MAKDVNIHVKTPGAQEAKQQLDGLAQSAKQVGQKVHEGGQQGAAGTDKLKDSTDKASSSFGKFGKSILGWAAKLSSILISIRLVTQAIRLQKEELEEHARVASEQQKKLLALQSMGTFFEEHPQARKEVEAYAAFGRRPFGDVAEAYYQLESKGAGLTKAQKAGIMQEALELGRMEPEADLSKIIDIFSLYAKETGQKEINQIQNVIRQTLSSAGAQLSEMGQYLPQFLSAGIAGGLSGAETAGLWAFATTRSGKPEQATTGIRNIFAALQGKGTPESQELLESLGLTPGMNIFEQLTELSRAQKAGKFGVPEAETIAGKENFAILLSMLTEPQAMMETVRQVARVDRPDIDITRDKLNLIMNQDEMARLEEEYRRLTIEIENLKGSDIEALKWKVWLKDAEKTMREQGAIAVQRHLALFRETIPSWFTSPAPEQPYPGLAHPTRRRSDEAPTIINDNSTHYHPRVGPDESGPRVGRDTK